MISPDNAKPVTRLPGLCRIVSATACARRAGRDRTVAAGVRLSVGIGSSGPSSAATNRSNASALSSMRRARSTTSSARAVATASTNPVRVSPFRSAALRGGHRERATGRRVIGFMSSDQEHPDMMSEVFISLPRTPSTSARRRTWTGVAAHLTHSRFLTSWSRPSSLRSRLARGGHHCEVGPRRVDRQHNQTQTSGSWVAFLLLKQGFSVTARFAEYGRI